MFKGYDFLAKMTIYCDCQFHFLEVFKFSNISRGLIFAVACSQEFRWDLFSRFREN